MQGARTVAAARAAAAAAAAAEVLAVVHCLGDLLHWLQALQEAADVGAGAGAVSGGSVAADGHCLDALEMGHGLLVLAVAGPGGGAAAGATTAPLVGMLPPAPHLQNLPCQLYHSLAHAHLFPLRRYCSLDHARHRLQNLYPQPPCHCPAAPHAAAQLPLAPPCPAAPAVPAPRLRRLPLAQQGEGLQA